MTKEPSAALQAPVVGLAVGHVHDPEEAAADARAEGALARLIRARQRRTPTAQGRDPRMGLVRRAPTPFAGPRIGPAGGVLDAPSTARIEALRGRGTPLPGPVRGRMEHAFGAELGQVRVHHGPEVARLNADISARAFTTGNDIFFGERFAPAEPAGERVLAHEIAHALDNASSIARLASAPVRRAPVKRVGAGAQDDDYTDTEYPGLLLKRISDDDDVYEIRNLGPSLGHRVVWMEQCDYYPCDARGASIEGARPIDLGALAARVIQTEYLSVGETGTGLANVAQRSRLRTFGLNTCVAWLLYNARAAYLTHIVAVGDPLKVNSAGIAEQVHALVELFAKKAGKAPTHVKISVNARQADPTSPPRNPEPAPWMKLLVPPGMPLEFLRGDDTFEHQVHPGDGPGVPTHWEGAPIKLTYDE